jgi:hypothetical protein
MTDDPLTGSIDDVAQAAERILQSIVPDAWCQAQEWDGRIDCGIRLADGGLAAEMIRLDEATPKRIRACAERLLARRNGIAVILQNELSPPIAIRRG